MLFMFVGVMEPHSFTAAGSWCTISVPLSSWLLPCTRQPDSREDVWVAQVFQASWHETCIAVTHAARRSSVLWVGLGPAPCIAVPNPATTSPLCPWPSHRSLLLFKSCAGVTDAALQSPGTCQADFCKHSLGFPARGTCAAFLL